jgi:uncharacterized UBP type Zn finger protein
MQNLTGALCYRHSLFQALVHSPIFANWLLKNHQPSDCIVESGETCVACAMKRMATAYVTSKTDELTESLKIVNHVFKASMLSETSNDNWANDG